MRVVVAGGAGFLGSHLCDALLERGDQVVCLDNFVTGSAPNVDAPRSGEPTSCSSTTTSPDRSTRSTSAARSMPS